jgi:Concanavalin A-like lectin/glucanases superfamily/Bacterial TSP3 repeat
VSCEVHSRKKSALLGSSCERRANFTDSSGNGLTLSPVSGAPAIVPGVIDNAASFDGSQFLYSSAYALTRWRSSFSVGAWVRASRTNGPDAVIIGNIFGSAGPTYSAGFTDHYGTVYGYYRGGGENVNSSGAVNIHDDRWHHIVVTFGPFASYGRLRLYIDGQFVKERITTYGTSGSVTEFSIGGRSILNNTFTGLIDEAFYADHVMSQTEITIAATAPDSDIDGVPDWDDNCPNTQNPGQENFDGDSAGDHCDDSDGDGLLDYEEIYIHSTDPLKADTDDDTFDDYFEVAYLLGTSPVDGQDFPGNGDYNNDKIVNVANVLGCIQLLFQNGYDVRCDAGRLDINNYPNLNFVLDAGDISIVERRALGAL